MNLPRVLYPSCSRLFSVSSGSRTRPRLVHHTRLKPLSYDNHVRMQSYSTPPSSELETKPDGFAKRAFDAYENYLKINFPKLFMYSRRLTGGSSACLFDLKVWWRVRAKLREGISPDTFTIDELTCYLLTPPSILKGVVIAVLITLPGAFPVLGLSMIFLPRMSLTRHFWTKEQKSKFWLATLKMRQSNHARYLRQKIQHTLPLGVWPNRPYDYLALNRMNELLKTDLQLDDALEVQNLSVYHWYHLTRINGQLPYSSATKLTEKMHILQSIDRKLDADWLDNADLEQLQLQMFMRQLSYEGLSQEQIAHTLKTWIQFSSHGIPLWTRLHAPVLLNQDFFSSK